MKQEPEVEVVTTGEIQAEAKEEMVKWTTSIFQGSWICVSLI